MFKLDPDPHETQPDLQYCEAVPLLSCSNSGFSSSSSPVVHNLLLKKKFCKCLFSIYQGLFNSQKRYQSFALLFAPALYLKGQISFILQYIIDKIFVSVL